MNRFRVRFTSEAEEDLLRLFDFLILQDFAAAERAQAAMTKAVELLEVFPFSCRKAIGGAEVFKLGEQIASRAVQVVFRIMGIDAEEIGGSRHQLPKPDSSNR